ncbi:hypothetical protein A5719_10725 [Mycolicibacterium peregrinum]|uniref:hypothetical protein n=1 Tax=Mycolicibacterium peregrinum TaxID=43304 RepID=UPI0007EA774D|nr:hypothetical protein [Mycolicibacterium peregrinum]OBF41853.1 hypothetical protein A5719_10725 [Mycolicibacterium peregrinum]
MFVPPRHERVPAAIDDLIAFAARDDVALLAPIVERFAHAIERAVVNGRQLITQLREIRASWNERVTARSD